MSKKIEDSNLESRAARKRLAPSQSQVWQQIERDFYLGYFKGNEMGVWTARWSRRRGRDKEERLAYADDFAEADGIKVMDFEQARAAARNWCAEQVIKESALPIDDRPFISAGPACGRD